MGLSFEICSWLTQYNGGALANVKHRAINFELS